MPFQDWEQLDASALSGDVVSRSVKPRTEGGRTEEPPAVSHQRRDLSLFPPDQSTRVRAPHKCGHANVRPEYRQVQDMISGGLVAVAHIVAAWCE